MEQKYQMNQEVEHTCPSCGHHRRLSSEWRGRLRTCEMCGWDTVVARPLPPIGIILVQCVLALRAMLSVGLVASMVIALVQDDVASIWHGVAWWRSSLASMVSALALAGAWVTMGAMRSPIENQFRVSQSVAAIALLTLAESWIYPAPLMVIFQVMLTATLGPVGYFIARYWGQRVIYW